MNQSIIYLEILNAHNQIGNRFTGHSLFWDVILNICTNVAQGNNNALFIFIKLIFSKDVIHFKNHTLDVVYWEIVY